MLGSKVARNPGCHFSQASIAQITPNPIRRAVAPHSSRAARAAIDPSTGRLTPAEVAADGLVTSALARDRPAAEPAEAGFWHNPRSAVCALLVRLSRMPSSARLMVSDPSHPVKRASVAHRCPAFSPTNPSVAVPGGIGILFFCKYVIV
ncbi:hypothetical protein MBOT_18480 [Mycobacterium botniense]|uniref:Uncharacterized protein n=1 Tax=Mycobacterium botniense TaxID=84962 RepID=A0A7I9XXH0_9MYCO|nr:hypothetical protein MBOT_18480 [Mycobacterium botniense]